MDRSNSFFVAAASVALAVAIGFAPAALAGHNDPANRAGPTGSQTRKNGRLRHRPLRRSDVTATIAMFKQNRPGIGSLFNDAYGYAVFPTVGKGGSIIGGDYGSGSVFGHGKLVGHATVTRLGSGTQTGDNAFSEVIFFQNAKVFDRFVQDNFRFGANVTSIAVPAGGTATGTAATLGSSYAERSIAVFTMTRSGSIVGIDIGGQKFSFTSASQAKRKR